MKLLYDNMEACQALSQASMQADLDEVGSGHAAEPAVL